MSAKAGIYYMQYMYTVYRGRGCTMNVYNEDYMYNILSIPQKNSELWNHKINRKYNANVHVVV